MASSSCTHENGHTLQNFELPRGVRVGEAVIQNRVNKVLEKQGEECEMVSPKERVSDQAKETSDKEERTMEAIDNGNKDIEVHSSKRGVASTRDKVVCRSEFKKEGLEDLEWSKKKMNTMSRGL